jgi:putative membrane protein
MGITASMCAGMALGWVGSVRADDRYDPPVDEQKTDKSIGEKTVPGDITHEVTPKNVAPKSDIVDKGAVSKYTTSKASPRDEAFIKRAAEMGLAQIKLGQLASDRATTQGIKDFAMRMVDDHQKSNDDLKAIADAKSVVLPTQISVEDHATFDKLSKLEGKAFDDAYLHATMKEHDKAVPLFEREAKATIDVDLKSFANRTLPTLKEHNREALRNSHKM